ncbi:MAG: glutamine cyclotransferase [Hyphomicrobiales bacterium]|nr:MAG: glutamine cyclotransferase [Hyphomicrobiales bacterium]
MKQLARVTGEFAANIGGPVHGVSYDGHHVWAATGTHIRAFDPADGTETRALLLPAHAGTAFDGHHLFQIANDLIQKVDPTTGAIVATIPAPGGGKDSGLAWADGYLWVGQYRDRQIVQIDAGSGAIVRVISTSRFVTGVTWVDGELWHGYSEDGTGGLARIDPDAGHELAVLDMPGMSVSGLESDGGQQFFCGGGNSGVVRIVSRS